MCVCMCVCDRITTSVEGLRTARPQTYSTKEDRKREREVERRIGGGKERASHIYKTRKTERHNEREERDGTLRDGMDQNTHTGYQLRRSTMSHIHTKGGTACRYQTWVQTVFVFLHQILFEPRSGGGAALFN